MQRHGIDDRAVAVEEIGAEGAGGQFQFHTGKGLLGWFWVLFPMRFLHRQAQQTQKQNGCIAAASIARLNRKPKVRESAKSPRCRRFRRWLRAAAFTRFSRLHLEGIVEAVEVVEQADGAEQLHDLAF